MVEIVNGEVHVSLDPAMTQAQLKVYGSVSFFDITMDILAHRANIVHKEGLYTKCQYGDGSVLVSSPYEIYAGMSPEKPCWCREGVKHSPLCLLF